MRSMCFLKRQRAGVAEETVRKVLGSIYLSRADTGAMLSRYHTERCRRLHVTHHSAGKFTLLLRRSGIFIHLDSRCRNYYKLLLRRVVLTNFISCVCE